MNRFVRIALISVALAGCGPTQKTTFYRLDGQPIPGNPALFQQAETDRAICLGEGQKANLSAGTYNPSLAALQSRQDAVGTVIEGCMAARGYRAQHSPAG